MKEINTVRHLDAVLVGSLFRLPWECEDGGIEDDGVVDLHVLLIMHRNRECVDTSCLKTQMSSNELQQHQPNNTEHWEDPKCFNKDKDKNLLDQQPLLACHQ